GLGKRIFDVADSRRPPVSPPIRQGLKPLSHSESPRYEDWEKEFLTLLIHAAHPLVRQSARG
ncbi:hypothetical protein QUB41_00270, partial [Microcoleus sp. AT8-B2]|uniref:hypothetical protein n=1 Tax=Microcoleus sp. AT8-B2 TaxID=2818618 RepID=UPI002FCF602A